MTNQEILEKAIQKAIDGGWQWPWDKDYLKFNYTSDDADIELWNGGEYEDATTLHSYAVIFNHDFAKALWGDKPTAKSYTGQGPDLLPTTYIVQKPAWRYYLQQMVIAEDPIKYLGEHLDG